MRINRILKEYDNIRRQFEENGKPLPEYIQKEYEEKLFIDDIWRRLTRFADGNAVPKAGWHWISQMCEKKYFISRSEEMVIIELQKLQSDLLTDPELLVDGNTLSRKGRKRLRTACQVIAKLL